MEMFTAGHSNVELKVFYDMVQAAGVNTIVDIRSFPGSKKFPWFNIEHMRNSVRYNGLQYVHIPELGGRRSLPDSGLMGGWKNKSFRSYAEYTMSDDYELGVEKLLDLASKERVCFFCSESCCWRCHRLIVSNTLVSRGHKVIHLIGKKQGQHELGMYGATPRVRDDGKIVYP